jgi:hypothetical protein
MKVGRMRKRLGLATIFSVLLVAFSNLLTAGELQLVDAHIHYSHDAWEGISPAEAVKMLRRAGLRRAFVSSSSDEGTQKLYKIAPDLIVPVLRPYRKRGELSSWMHDESVMAMLSERLSRNYYAGIGEFHADGEQIDLPVLQQVIALAKRYQIFLHAHVDVEAVHRIFATDPDALVLWAHAGFESPEVIATLMKQYPNLWADLAFREEFAFQGDVEDEWLRLFERFPARFMLGTDTYTPQRWFYVAENADWARGWLPSLPADIADNIAYLNAEALLARMRK